MVTDRIKKAIAEPIQKVATLAVTALIVAIGALLVALFGK
jgi:hypothetical protein